MASITEQIEFTVAAGPVYTLTRSGGHWDAAGFAADDIIRVEGSDLNDGRYTVENLANDVMTVTEAVVAETKDPVTVAALLAEEATGVRFHGPPNARVDLFMEPAKDIGFGVYDDAAAPVLLAYIGGADVGDVVIGKYAAGSGMKWDESEDELIVLGTLKTGIAGSRLEIDKATNTLRLYNADNVICAELIDGDVGDPDDPAIFRVGGNNTWGEIYVEDADGNQRCKLTGHGVLHLQAPTPGVSLTIPVHGDASPNNKGYAIDYQGTETFVIRHGGNVTTVGNLTVGGSINGGAIRASDNVFASADTERTEALEVLTKRKEIKTKCAGPHRVSFRLKSSTGADYVEGRVYKNGAAVGLLQSTDDVAFQTYTEDITFAVGDKIQLYVRTTQAAATSAVTDQFRIAGDLLAWATVVTD
jgi:hypothetical protein